MNKNEMLSLQIKQNVLNHLKNLNLSKKDKDFLLDLIKLFDSLAKNDNEKFINSLTLLINNVELEKKEELNVRLSSLNTQLEHSKYIEIRHFSFFSFYIQNEKIDIYIKKISINWNLLILEIKKIEFTFIRILIYKSFSKKEKILNKELKNTDEWETELIEILENNICINVRITLNFKKKPN